MPRIRWLIAGALAVAVASSVLPRGAIAARLTFTGSELALGAPATSLSDVWLDDEAYMAAVGGARIALVAFDDAGGSRLAGEIALPSGTDAAGVVSIGEPDEPDSSVPWQGDLLVSDRAGADLLHLQRRAGVWQVVGTLPTGTAPGPPIPVAGGASPIFGVLNAGSDSLSLFAPGSGTWRPAGARSVGARPVDAASFGLPDSGDEALAVVNAGAGTLSILSGKGYSRRRDISVGRAPVAVDVWDQDDDVTIAVANSGSSSVSIVSLGYRREPRVRTLTLPGTRPVAVALERFDRDPKVDVAVADGAGRRLSVLTGSRAGGFRAAATVNLPDEPVDLTPGGLTVLGRSGVLSTYERVDDRQLADTGIGIAAQGGRVIWTARERGRYRLFERGDGGAQPVAGAGPSRRPIIARLGRDPGGQPAAAYLRCSKRRCRPYRYDFGRAREVGLRHLLVPGDCRLTDVATWRRRVAYVLGGTSCPTRLRGVWLRSGHRQRRLGNGTGAHLGSLTGRFLGWSEWQGRGLDAVPAFRLADSHTTRVRTLMRFPSWYDYDLGFALTGPFVDGDALYWATYGDSSIALDQTSRLYRQSGITHRRCRRHVTYTDESELGIPGNWDEGRVDFAVDGRRIFYVDFSAPFAAQTNRLDPLLTCRRR